MPDCSADAPMFPGEFSYFGAPIEEDMLDKRRKIHSVLTGALRPYIHSVAFGIQEDALTRAGPVISRLIDIFEAGSSEEFSIRFEASPPAPAGVWKRYDDFSATCRFTEAGDVVFCDTSGAEVGRLPGERFAEFVEAGFENYAR